MAIFFGRKEGLEKDFYRAWAASVEVKDPFKWGHSLRVAEYAVAIARAMKFPDVEKLHIAALLHDIGKGAVPEAILLKPEPLTAEERQVLHLHSEAGYLLAKEIPGLGEDAPLWIRHHHEAWDGTGYPQGLREEEIPLGARILAVADAFEALTHSRAHRRRVSSTEAKKILQDQSGRQWDPKVVQSALKTLPDALPDESPAYPFYGFLESLLQLRIEESRKFNLLSRIGEGFRTLTHPQTYPKKVLEILEDCFPEFDASLIAIRQDQEYWVRGVRHLPESLLEWKISRKEKQLDAAILSQNPSFYSDMPVEHPLHPVIEATGMTFLAFLPLSFLDKDLGFILFLAKEKKGLDPSDVRFLSTAAQILSPVIDSIYTYEKMGENVITDEPTGAYTWRLFNYRFIEEVSRARRYNEKLSCLYVHFPDYARIQEKYGDKTSESALRAVYLTLTSNLRASDFISRYGENSYLILLPVTPYPNAQIAAKRIRTAFESKPLILFGRELRSLRLAWGASSFPDDGSTVKELVEKAIQRMKDAFSTILRE